jgi:hypothetical protein
MKGKDGLILNIKEILENHRSFTGQITFCQKIKCMIY